MALSLDQRGILLARHSVKNGESSLSGEKSNASLRKGNIYSFGSNFIFDNKIVISSLFFSSFNPDFNLISSLCSYSSEISPSGEYKIKFEFKNKTLVPESLTIAKKIMLVSITSSIYTNLLYTLSHMPFLTFLPRAIASSSDKLLSETMASSSSSSAAVFLIASVIYDKTAVTDLTITGNDVLTSTV